MDIVSINPKLKQSELAEELAISTFTLQRYTKETNLIFLPTSKTQTRKQKT